MDECRVAYWLWEFRKAAVRFSLSSCAMHVCFGIPEAKITWESCWKNFNGFSEKFFEWEKVLIEVWQSVACSI